MAVGEVPTEARIRPALKQAWTNIWPHFWWLLLFGVLTGLATNLNAGSQTYLGSGTVLFVNGFGGLVAVFLGMPLTAGLVKAHLAASRGDKPTWQDYGYAFGPRYWQTLGLGLLTALIVMAGLLLLVIPGLILAVKLTFVYQRFIEDDLAPVDAIKASLADTNGRWWNVLGLGLMGFLLVVAGALALGVGIFVAFVLIQQMAVVYWRALAEQGSSEPAATPTA